MSPLTLFWYVLAVTCGIGFGVLAVLWVFCQMIDWDKYYELQNKKCNCRK